MKAGVSTSCLYPMPTEKSLIELGKKGIKNVEIYLCCFSECEKTFLKEIELINNAYQINTVSVHPFTAGFEGLMFFSDYDRRFYDGVEMYKRFANAAVSMGADILVFHGNSRAMEVEQGRYFERFVKLREIIQKEGVRLCQENVSRCQSYSPDFIKNMIKNIPEAEFVLDTKQAVRSGITPIDMLTAMGNNVAHIHISDNNTLSPCLALGKGNFDVENFLNSVKEFNNEIAIIVELYRNNFEDSEELRKSYNFLKKTLM